MGLASAEGSGDRERTEYSSEEESMQMIAHPPNESSAELFARADELESRRPEEIVEWAVKKFDGALTLACSFGMEDVALLHMLVTRTSAPNVLIVLGMYSSGKSTGTSPLKARELKWL